MVSLRPFFPFSVPTTAKGTGKRGDKPNPVAPIFVIGANGIARRESNLCPGKDECNGVFSPIGDSAPRSSQRPVNNVVRATSMCGKI